MGRGCGAASGIRPGAVSKTKMHDFDEFCSATGRDRGLQNRPEQWLIPDT